MRSVNIQKIYPNQKDELLPVERMERVASPEAFDRYPCVPFLGDSSASWIGQNVRNYWHSVEYMVNTEIEVFNRLGHDGLGLGPDAYGIAEALGAEVIFPEDSGPYAGRGRIEDYQQLSNRELLNPKRDGRMPLFLEACKILRDKADGIVGVGSSIAGPFTIAGYLRGVERLLRDIYREEENVHILMRYVTDSCKVWVDTVAGLDVGISMADPLASPSILNPKKYAKLVYPYTKELVDYVYEKTGKKPGLHMCGNTVAIWPYLKQLSVASLSLDNIIDFGKAKEEFQDVFCIMGNVDPVGVISQGTKEEIEADVRRCIHTMGKCKKGYAVASGCQIPIGTPREKVEYFVEAVRKYSCEGLQR